MHKSIGFNINVYHRDNKFNINDLREHIRPSSLNLFEKGLHITINEISTTTINQVAHCTTHYITYKRYTRLMIIQLVECIRNSRNYFP